MLDLGVTPSQVSLHVEEDPDGDHIDGSRTYCVPLQSLGLGGNRITCLGAGYLADGLKTNTSKFQIAYSIMLNFLLATIITNFSCMDLFCTRTYIRAGVM